MLRLADREKATCTGGRRLDIWRSLTLSSSGLGHRPFTAVTRVRIPLGSPFDSANGLAHDYASRSHSTVRIRRKTYKGPRRMVLSERQRAEGPVSIGRVVLTFPMYFVYILRTSANTLYIGVTESLDQRISTHNSGKGAEWIKAHRGARLVYCESHATLGSARKREIQLKKWSRAKKEALIARDFVMLKNLSRCKSSATLSNHAPNKRKDKA
jgi:putative endonuclease